MGTSFLTRSASDRYAQAAGPLHRNDCPCLAGFFERRDSHFDEPLEYACFRRNVAKDAHGRMVCPTPVGIPESDDCVD